MKERLLFDTEKYEVKTLKTEGHELCYREFARIPYVANPVYKKYQSLSIYAPEAYYEGKCINEFSMKTAPIFMPNRVGGYMPGPIEEPELNYFGRKEPNTVWRALERGYIVVSPAIRGRTLQSENGDYCGNAPACIVDYKAAARYLHFNAERIPGNVEKIITNGGSAGGALSALMGSTGDSKDYESYLKEIGAADASDAIFAASCYCPIINLEHADMAYEWQFAREMEYHQTIMKLGEDGQPSYSEKIVRMTPEQQKISKEEAALFPAYLNSLDLKDEEELNLDENGEGSFKNYVLNFLIRSAQKALEDGVDLSGEKWITIKDGKVIAADFTKYAETVTRMKPAPSFDDVNLNSFENDLFGSETGVHRHFTKYSLEHSTGKNLMAESEVIKLMNPMYYIEDEKAKKAKYFRIRVGEQDRDTSLAISIMFATMLRNRGCKVDYFIPWGIPHSANYDVEELFEWIERIAKETI